MLSALTSLFSRWRHPGTDALSEYLDSMLSPRRQAQVARHLESCDGCQAELASLQLTVGLLQRVPQVEPPRSFIFTAPPFTAPPLVERPRRPQGALNWALAGAGASLALLLAVVLSADMVGVLRGDDGESAQQEASPSSDASIAATQAIGDMMADPPPQAVMAPAAAPPPASAPTPPAPAVERYTRPPVEPIEEAEPPAGVVAEDISALISQFAAATMPEEASEAAGPVDVEGLTEEILDTMERDGPLTKELEAVIREAVRNAAEAGSEEAIVAEQLMAAAAPAATPTPAPAPAATPTPAPAPMAADTATPKVAEARDATASEEGETTDTIAEAVAAAVASTAATPSPPPTTAEPLTPATPTSTGTPAPTPAPAPTSAPTPRSTLTSAEAPAPLPTLAPTPLPTLAPTEPPPAPSREPMPAPTAAPTVTLKPVPSTSAPAPPPENTASMREEKAAVTVLEQQISTPETAMPQLVDDELGDTAEGATSVWWRVLEGLLATCAVVALGLFFRRRRRGRAA